jgi:hypothetical protein
MARSQSGKKSRPPHKPELIPPGATRKALDEVPLPGGGPPPSDLGDRHASGTPGGGTEIGGLAGTNIGEGDPDMPELDETLGSGVNPINEEEDEDKAAYGGPSGGAVGGTPAEGRSSGGHVHGGIAPGGSHRGDSTIGSKP